MLPFHPMLPLILLEHFLRNLCYKCFYGQYPPLKRKNFAAMREMNGSQGRMVLQYLCVFVSWSTIRSSPTQFINRRMELRIKYPHPQILRMTKFSWDPLLRNSPHVLSLSYAPLAQQTCKSSSSSHLLCHSTHPCASALQNSLAFSYRRGCQIHRRVSVAANETFPVSLKLSP